MVVKKSINFTVYDDDVTTLAKTKEHVIQHYRKAERDFGWRETVIFLAQFYLEHSENNKKM